MERTGIYTLMPLWPALLRYTISQSHKLTNGHPSFNSLGTQKKGKTMKKKSHQYWELLIFQVTRASSALSLPISYLNNPTQRSPCSEFEK